MATRAVPAGVEPDAAALRRAAVALRGARQVVVMTGAGMSAESGIPTFREPLTGVWARYDPEELATAAAFRRAPARVFGWYAWRRRLVRAARPHAGHHALVALGRVVPELAIVTQNVDGLHRRAGSAHVLELHGSLERFSCVAQRHPVPTDEIPEPATDAPCEPPRCRQCGAPVRPDVVWFGEALPRRVAAEAWDRAASCQAMLVIGTSGLVQPAAELPYIARHAGATVIAIDPDPGEGSAAAHIILRGRAGVVLPALVAALTEGEPL
ncbi:MAG TPA: NAD-dependent deacylase [Gemmatimonadales bacterium]|nr:NAD-dependent deacylase [Gemmatimonadales bacterium]